MASNLIDELRSLNYSNQMDNDEHRWAALCNLLEDFAENVNLVEDLPAHDRRVAREGFASDAELCHYLAEQVSKQVAKLMCVSEKLMKLAVLHRMREYACGE